MTKISSLSLIVFPLFLSGCSTIYNWANGVGKHMPTIGEPCYNWQCMTSSGQAQSDKVKQTEEFINKESSTTPEPTPLLSPTTK